MKLSAKLACGVVLSSPILCAADTGNVISWCSNSRTELMFTCQTAVVKLELIDANVARVRLVP